MKNNTQTRAFLVWRYGCLFYPLVAGSECAGWTKAVCSFFSMTAVRYLKTYAASHFVCLTPPDWRFKNEFQRISVALHILNLSHKRHSLLLWHVVTCLSWEFLSKVCLVGNQSFCGYGGLCSTTEAIATGLHKQRTSGHCWLGRT